MKTVKSWLPIGILAVVVAYALIDGPRFAAQIAYAVTKGENQAARDQLATLAKGDTLSPLFVQVAKVIKPAVVEVRVTKKVKMQDMPDMDQFFQHFFGDDNSPFGMPQPPGKWLQPRPQPQPRQYLQRGVSHRRPRGSISMPFSRSNARAGSISKLLAAFVAKPAVLKTGAAGAA